MLCLSGFELYSRWVPLKVCVHNVFVYARTTRKCFKLPSHHLVKQYRMSHKFSNFCKEKR